MEKDLAENKLLECQSVRDGPSSSQQYSLDIFPIEIWEEIFNHLTDARDLLTCIKTSKVWKEAVKMKAPIYLFQKILPIIAKYINLNDMLACRLVSRSWKKSVNHFLQYHPCHLRLDGHYYSDEDTDDDDEDAIESWQKYMHWFQCHFDIENFLRRLENHDRSGNSPFINRRVSILFNEFSYGQTCDDTWSSINHLLQNYGSHIWYFTCTIFCNQPPDRFYNRLQRFISWMPNLKVIYVDYNGGVQNQYQLMTLEEVVNISPLTNLPYLIKFRSGSLPNSILNEALSKYSHIQKLHIQKPLYIAGDCRFYDYQEDLILSKLTDLAQPLHHENDLFLLEKVGWPLEALTLVNFNPERIELSTIFEALSKCRFSERLKYLNLIMHHPVMEDGWKDSKTTINLPNLHKLRISCIGSHFKNVDFLIQLRKLEELTFKFEDCDALMEGEEEGTCQKQRGVNGVIQFSGYCDKLYGSNIWSIVPNLQTVLMKTKFDVGVYDWEYKQFYYTRRSYLNKIRKSDGSETIISQSSSFKAYKYVPLLH